tara:strand:+ start:254 stop:1324 length:1071 start_codon:yes stop_codon:yes gene_type:complete
LGGILWYLVIVFGVTNNVTNGVPKTTVPSVLAGSLYITLPVVVGGSMDVNAGGGAPADTMTKNTPEGFLFDVQTDAASNFAAAGVRNSVQHNISSNIQWITFFGVPDTDTQSENERMSLYRGVLDGTRDSVSQVTKLYGLEHVYAQQSPTVSNDGKVAVSVFDGQTEPSELASALGIPGVGNSSAWQILIFDSEGKELITRFGTQPEWASNSILVYLTDEGPTAYNVDEETEYSLIRVEDGVVATNSMLDVSDDGNYLVWTLPDSRLVYVLEIRNLEDPQQVAVYSRQIFENILGFWPVLSTDGSYVALLELGDPEREDSLRAEVTFLDVTNGERVPYTIDVSNYDVSQLALTDWK